MPAACVGRCFPGTGRPDEIMNGGDHGHARTIQLGSVPVEYYYYDKTKTKHLFSCVIGPAKPMLLAARGPSAIAVVGLDAQTRREESIQ